MKRENLGWETLLTTAPITGVGALAVLTDPNIVVRVQSSRNCVFANTTEKKLITYEAYNGEEEVREKLVMSFDEVLKRQWELQCRRHTNPDYMRKTCVLNSDPILDSESSISFEIFITPRSPELVINSLTKYIK